MFKKYSKEEINAARKEIKKRMDAAYESIDKKVKDVNSRLDAAYQSMEQRDNLTPEEKEAKKAKAKKIKNTISGAVVLTAGIIVLSWMFGGGNDSDKYADEDETANVESVAKIRDTQLVDKNGKIDETTLLAINLEKTLLGVEETQKIEFENVNELAMKIAKTVHFDKSTGKYFVTRTTVHTIESNVGAYIAGILGEGYNLYTNAPLMPCLRNENEFNNGFFTLSDVYYFVSRLIYVSSESIFKTCSGEERDIVDVYKTR